MKEGEVLFGSPLENFLWVPTTLGAVIGRASKALAQATD